MVVVVYVFFHPLVGLMDGLQSRSDFVKGQAGVSPSLNLQEECLGLAVLDLWCHAKEQGLGLKEICKRVGYLNKLCLVITK